VTSLNFLSENVLFVLNYLVVLFKIENNPFSRINVTLHVNILAYIILKQMGGF
jgi:hypothetical protein